MTSPQIEAGTSSVEGCEKPVGSKGWCVMHYTRWKRNGHPLGGNTFRGEPLKFVLEVASHKDGAECVNWPFPSKKPRPTVLYGGHIIHASRAVCIEAYGSPPTPKHHAAHSCGNGHLGCVNPQHLRWATAKENEADKLVHGTHNRGKRRRRVKPVGVYA